MTTHASAKVLQLLERRLELLRKLIRAGEEWRRAFIRLHLDESELRAADEELLCRQIGILDREIMALRSKEPEASSTNFQKTAPADSGIRAALAETAALHLELKQSNELKVAILKRSKFTINALRNLFNSLAPTYAAPAAPSVGTIYEENV